MEGALSHGDTSLRIKIMKITSFLIALVLGFLFQSQNNVEINEITTNHSYKNAKCEIVFFDDSVFVVVFDSGHFSFGSWSAVSRSFVTLDASSLPFEKIEGKIRDVLRISNHFINLTDAKVEISSNTLIKFQAKCYNTEEMELDLVESISEEILEYRRYIHDLEKSKVNE